MFSRLRGSVSRGSSGGGCSGAECAHTRCLPDRGARRWAARRIATNGQRSERQRLEGRIPSRGGLPPIQVAEIQRNRLLAGALDAIEEHGYAQMTVAQITRRSRVSRRTFYETFENREACLLALLDDALASIEAELAAANLGGLAWRERVRGGLWAILMLLRPRRPALARVLVDQSLHGELAPCDRAPRSRSGCAPGRDPR